MGVSVRQSDLLNHCRWIAAGLVVAEHVRSLLILDYASDATSNPVYKAFYVATGFGHEAVVVFFFISGFLVGGSVVEKLQTDAFHPGRYLADRVSRLYAVLVVALMLGAVLDFAGYKLLNGAGYYDATYDGSVAVLGGESVVERLTPQVFFVNLLMGQTIVGPTFGSNGPLWSLAFEWWYYLLFPLLLGITRRPAWLRIACAASAVLIASFVGARILILFGVWMLGVAASVLNHRRWLPPALAWLGFAVALLAMRFEIVPGQYAASYAVGITFAAVINSYATVEKPMFGRGIARFLADFSYSLYLVHFPVVLLAASAVLQVCDRRDRLSCSPSSMAAVGLVVLVAYACAYGTAQVTETRTALFRRNLYRLFRLQSEKVSPVTR